jgi:hypothetical protein
MAPRHFRYFADPICIAALIIYPINRWVLKPYGLSGAFGTCYLNDLLCLPLFLPMILYVQRRIGLRLHDGPPRMWEILQHWAIFSVLFEAILPRYPRYFRSVADPVDVVAYLAGGITAWLCWQWMTNSHRPAHQKPLYYLSHPAGGSR